ncbi:MAG: glycosyltransferase family 2 protein [Leptospiraceae bacterium]|nr:glycosyltransferase family 2 protein [Leptospiraceae bacterium]
MTRSKSSHPRPVVSVILPTYKEAANIPVLLAKLQSVLSAYSYEIIVVDDDSPDQTWAVAENFAPDDARIRVIRRLDKRGLSSAVMDGMAIAHGQCLAVMDSDLQHDESALPALIQAINTDGYQIAIGSRGVDGGSYGDFSKSRRFISWTAATMARLMLPITVKDPMSGFFAIARDTFRNSRDRINPLGFKILLEFIGRNPAARVVEIGYQFRLRLHGETKLSGSVIRNYLIALYDIRFGRFISSTFMLYAMVGASGVFINFAGFWLGNLLGLGAVQRSLPLIGHLELAAPFGIELSILSNYFLNNYITFYEFRHRGLWGNMRGLFEFQAISMLGFLIQWGVFQLLYSNGFLIDVLMEPWARYANYLIGIVIAMATNYYLNVNFTWNQNRS